MTPNHQSRGSFRVAVVGATSQISRFLMPRLEQSGIEVVPFARTTSMAYGRRTYLIDQLTPAKASSIGKIDALVTTAPIQAIQDVLMVAQMLEPRQIVAISSMSKLAKADSTAPEDQQLVFDLKDAEMRLKTSCAETGVSWTLMRPTMIYGTGTDRNIAFIADIIRRAGFFPIGLGAKGLRQPIHADDLAAACVSALQTPTARYQEFQVGGGERLSYRQMVRRIFEGLHRKPIIVPIPLFAFQMAVWIGSAVPTLAFIKPAMVERMYDDLVADNSKAENLLGFSPRTFRPDAVTLGQVDQQGKDGY